MKGWLAVNAKNPLDGNGALAGPINISGAGSVKSGNAFLTKAEPQKPAKAIQ